MVLVQKEGGIRSWLVACMDTVFRVLRLQSELSPFNESPLVTCACRDRAEV